MNIPTLIILINLYIDLIYCNNSIKIPFESKLCKGNENTDFLSNYYDQYLYTQISIGSENQKLEVALKLNKYITYLISSKNKNLKSEYFNEEKSITYEKVGEKAINPQEDMFISGIKSKDNFIFGDNIKYEKYLFYLSLEQNFDETGQIGLKMVPSSFDKDFTGNGFIDQLKLKSIINSNNFYFKYEYKDEKEFKYKGNLIIGGMPHEIEPSKLFNIDNFVKTYADINDLNTRWTIKLSSVKYGNETIIQSDSAEFSTTFGFIVAPLNFIKIFDIFFNKTKCYGDYNSEDKTYLYLYCEKNVDISKFKDLFFVATNKELNFTLTYKDLFRKIGEYYYFLILFNEDVNQWEFGHIFLKKYTMVFNGDQKTIGYYYQPNNNKDKSDSKNHIVYIFVIISIILLIIIMGLLIYIFYFKPKNRKVRPNELEDNFDYTPQDVEKEQDDNRLGV